MSLRERHAIHVIGRGKKDMIMAHGYGCDQNMWRLVAPAFEDEYRIILFDLAGCGNSDLSTYDREKYGTLDGHARDVVEIALELTRGPAVFVGHSVSAMTGLLADLRKPGLFSSHVMVAPSPCYIDQGDYVGGFSRADIESLLETLDSNYLGWASAMAPKIMGAPDQPALGEELTNSFCRTDPEIAKHFARVTFTSDNRADVPRLETPALVMQCTDDIIAPVVVGEYLHRQLPNNKYKLIENIGHCPHLSAPQAIVEAIREFLP